MVTDSFPLTADVDVTVQPHAHHLATEVKALPRCPTALEVAIYIRHWDFGGRGLRYAP
jgi:hypothetical protein